MMEAKKEATFNGTKWVARCFCSSRISVDPMSAEAYCNECHTTYLVYLLKKQNGTVYRVMLEESV